MEMHDKFREWLRSRSNDCEQLKLVLDNLLAGEYDSEKQEYTFFHAPVQAQWEAWKAALDLISHNLAEMARKIRKLNELKG